MSWKSYSKVRFKLTRLHLLAQFDPETLRIRIVEIDDFGKEQNDAGTPKYYAPLSEIRP